MISYCVFDHTSLPRSGLHLHSLCPQFAKMITYCGDERKWQDDPTRLPNVHPSLLTTPACKMARLRKHQLTRVDLDGDTGEPPLTSISLVLASDACAVYGCVCVCVGGGGSSLCKHSPPCSTTTRSHSRPLTPLHTFHSHLSLTRIQAGHSHRPSTLASAHTFHTRSQASLNSFGVPDLRTRWLCSDLCLLALGSPRLGLPHCT
jgi:hypothetical protein